MTIFFTLNEFDESPIVGGIVLMNSLLISILCHLLGLRVGSISDSIFVMCQALGIYVRKYKNVIS